jgi:hypothetical protein
MKGSDPSDVFQNVVLVNIFKQVYKQLDPEKKGYIRLKDLVSSLIDLYTIELNCSGCVRREQA